MNGQFTGTLVRLESEDGGDGFCLVADGICERCNSAVGQPGTELIGRTGRVHMRDDVHLVAQRDRRLVFDRGAQRCSIQKIHNLANKIEKAGPMTVKWEGGAAPEICTILEERLADKKHKLRAIAKPKILLLLDWYHFAHAKMFLECVPRLPCLSCFHTVFVIRSESGNFVLHSENSGWRQGEPALLVGP